MSGVPKSLKDFKKANNNNMQNTILNAKGAKQQNASLDMPMQQNQQLGNMGENLYQDPFRQQQEFIPQPDFMGQGEFPQALKPNFNEAYNNVGMNDIVSEPTKDNTSNSPKGEMGFGMNMQFPPMGNMQQPIQQPFVEQPKEVPPVQQQIPQPVVQTEPSVQMQKTVEKKEETRKVEEKNMRNDYRTQSYQQVPLSPMPEKKTGTKNNKNIVAHVQEIEAEIDGLVNNTEAFLNNTKILKIQILETKSKEELNAVMQRVQETLRDIPASFIDAETRRRLRLCFSYLHKTKKELLEKEQELKEVQDSLAHLVSIDDIDELEETILNIPATPTTDNVYEIRTFEINLVNQLPEIKEELLKERISAVYNY